MPTIEMVVERDNRIAELEAQVEELRQALIGGIELVYAERPMEVWAEANERLLERQRTKGAS